MNQLKVRENLTPEYDYAVIAKNFVKELRENRARRISGLTMTATTAPVLTDNKTLNKVVNCLTENIPIKSQGKCEQKNIFEILIRTATQKDSIENTTKVLKNVPTSNDIRYHLEKYSDLTSFHLAGFYIYLGSMPRSLESIKSLNFTSRVAAIWASICEIVPTSYFAKTAELARGGVGLEQFGLPLL